jgi:hypothetical protein
MLVDCSRAGKVGECRITADLRGPVCRERKKEDRTATAKLTRSAETRTNRGSLLRTSRIAPVRPQPVASDADEMQPIQVNAT